MENTEMIPASLSLFLALCIGAAAYKLGRRWGYDHGYRKGCLDEYRDGIKDRLAGKKEAYSLGRAWGIKLATDMLSLNSLLNFSPSTSGNRDKQRIAASVEQGTARNPIENP